MTVQLTLEWVGVACIIILILVFFILLYIKGHARLKDSEREKSQYQDIDLEAGGHLDTWDIREEDSQGNNVFHRAAGDDWTDRDTELVLQQLRRKIRKQSLENSPITTSDIFSAQIDRGWCSGKITVNTANYQGETPLHVACDRDNISAVEALLKNGARIDVQDTRQSSPVHKAVAKNNLEILKILLEKERKNVDVGGLLRLRDNSNHTPISIAVISGFDTIVKYVIEELKDETWKEDEVLLTYLAAEGDYEKILDILVCNGNVWTNTWKVDGMNFLQKAVKHGNYVAVETIVRRKYFTEDDWIPAKNLAKVKQENGDKWRRILDFLENTERNNKEGLGGQKDSMKISDNTIVEQKTVVEHGKLAATIQKVKSLPRNISPQKFKLMGNKEKTTVDPIRRGAEEE